MARVSKSSIYIGHKKNILIGLVLFFAFLTGLTQTILFSVPMSLFLGMYSRDQLPLVYIGLGAAMFVFGWIFDSIEKKYSIFVSLSIPILLFALMLILFGWMLNLGSPTWLIPILIGSILIVFFSESVSSILYYQLFTTYELKRLYGCFFGSFALGGIVMGFSMGMLLEVFSEDVLLTGGGVLMLIAFFSLFAIRNVSTKKLSSRSEESKNRYHERESLGKKQDKQYVYKVFLLTAVSYLIYYIFDFIFNSEVQKVYIDTIQRTTFLGRFYAMVDIMNLVVSFLIYPFLYIKFGQKGAFLSFPILMSILSASAFIFSGLSLHAMWMFYLIIIAVIVLESFLESVVLSSMLQFFQPLRKNLREWAQFKNELIIVPLSILVSGVALYIFHYSIGLGIVDLLGVVLVLSLLMILIFYISLEKGYVSILVTSVSKNMFSFSRSSRLGKEEIEILEQKLDSREPELLVHVIKLLENAVPSKIGSYLKKGLKFEVADIRIFCLRRIFALGISSIASEVKELVDKETNPAVLAAALLTYSKITKSINPEYFEKINDSNPEVSSSILSSFLLFGSMELQETAKKKLNNLVQSENIQERMIAARVMNSYYDKFFLLKLLSDSSCEVRALASENCIKVDREVMTLLVDNLLRQKTKGSGLNSILSSKNLAVDEIASRFLSESIIAQKKMISVLSLIKTDESEQFLQSLLLTTRRELHKDILLALKVGKSSGSSINFEKILIRERENIAELKKIIKYLGGQNTEVLYTLIAREIQISQQFCYIVLSFLYPEISFASIDAMLMCKDENFESNIEEILLLSIKGDGIKKLKESLLYIPKRSEASVGEVKEAALKALEYSSKAYIPSLRSAAIYTLGLLKCYDAKEIIERQSEENDPLILEFKPIALGLLN